MCRETWNTSPWRVIDMKNLVSWHPYNRHSWNFAFYFIFIFWKWIVLWKIAISRLRFTVNTFYNTRCPHWQCNSVHDDTIIWNYIYCMKDIENWKGSNTFYTVYYDHRIFLQILYHMIGFCEDLGSSYWWHHNGDITMVTNIKLMSLDS